MSSLQAGAVVVWCRTDLRIDDNPALARAVELALAANTSVLPVYILDPRQFGTTPWESPKTGTFRAQFLLQCIADFKKRLRQLGSDLLVLVGKPETRLEEVVKRIGAKTVITERQVGDEERRADQRVRATIEPLGAELSELWGNTLYHADDLPFYDDFRDVPDVFTPFRETCEQKDIRPPMDPPRRGSLPLPEAELTGLDFEPSWEDLPFADPLEEPTEDERSAFLVKGGETAALARLKHYVWETDTVAKYFEIRNGMLGTAYSTKLSASLAHGCISARRIRHDIAEYERRRTKNKSTYWVVFELIWRDYNRFFAAKHGSMIFQVGGTTSSRRAWSTDMTALQRWKEGTTGWPLVDANMRELAATGFMSNRGRQNVASYLTLDLGIDWRAGADHFESLLVDYDVSSNWGNWVAAAGLTGGRLNKFDITKQGKDYDPGGVYVRTWIPELQGLQALPGARSHEPWIQDPDELEELGAASYPRKRLTASGVEGGRAQELEEKRSPRQRNDRLKQSDAKAKGTNRRGHMR